MSGPKVDMAEVRKQELSRLQQERLKRKLLAADIQKEIELLAELYDGLIKECCLQDGLDAPAQFAQAQKQQFIQALQEQLEEVCSANETFSTEQARQHFQAFRDSCAEEVKALRANVEAALEEQKRNQRVQNQSSQLAGGRKSQITFLGKETQQQLPSVQQLTQMLQQQLQETMTQPGLNAVHKTAVINFRQRLDEILSAETEESRKQRKLINLQAEFAQLQDVVERELRILRAAYLQYCQECFDSQARPLESFRNLEEIRQATEAAKAMADQNLAKEYIQRQIDEVMTKHGYAVMEGERLEKLAATGQTLYEVNDGTAINVFVSSNNQVSMRVVGIGIDEEITSEEDERLYQEQCAFCAMHPKITAELAMRGVILHTREHKLPDRKYNKKINTGTASGSPVSNRKRKNNPAVQKVMYRS